MNSGASIETIDPRAIEWCYRGFIDNLCANTKRAYERDLAIFAEWRGDTDTLRAIQGFVGNGLVSALDEGNRYCAWLFGRSRARRTAVRRLAALRSLIRRLECDGAITWSLRLPPPHATAKDRQRDRDNDQRQPTTEMLSKLGAKLATTGRKIVLRDRLIVYFGSVLLLRNLEMQRLRLADIDWRRSVIAVQGLSTRNDLVRCIPPTRPRTVPIPAAILPDLREWVEIVESVGSEKLFVRVLRFDRVTPYSLHRQAFSLIVRKLFKQIGVTGGNMRALRTGGIATMLDQMRVSGASPADIADVAGLSNLAQLRRRWKRGNTAAQREVVDIAATVVGAPPSITMYSPNTQPGSIARPHHGS